MRRFLTLMLAVLTLVAFAAVPAQAARPENLYPVTFNGHPVNFDVKPELINDRTFVPFRAIFEKMGATVDFDGTSNTITAVRDNVSIKLQIGSATAYVNGTATTLPAAPYIKEDRTLVPLRFVGEAFGAEVSYNDATTAISIVDKNWPKRGGQLNLAMWNKPNGPLNPIIYDDQYGGWVMAMMWDGLWRYDDKMSPQPALADSWEWSENDTKLTFYLNKNAKYFDGNPIRARDVVFAYKAIFHPKYVGPRNSGYEDVLGWEEYTKGIKGETPANFDKGIVTADNIEGLYAVDDYTVVFKLKQPNAAFFIGQTGFGPLRYEDYKDLPIQDWGTAKDPKNFHANGTGAFIMEEYRDGESYILKANPNYWAGKPYVDKAVWRVIDSAVATGEMETGKIDFAEFTAPDLQTYSAMKPKVETVEFPDMVYQQMVFNTLEGPASDKMVRQAISYAIDRQSIIHNLMNDHGSTMYTPIHPLTWGYSDDNNHYDYNPAKARELLDQAGWKVGSDGIRVKDGKKMTMRLIYPNVGNPVRQATAPYVQQLLKAIGIDVKLEGYDWPTLTEKTKVTYDFDMYFIGFVVPSPDPDPTGVWDKSATVVGGFNGSRWWTQTSEDLLAKAKTTTDVEARMEYYRLWQQEWTDQAPGYIFYAVNTMYAYNTRLQNFRPGPQGVFWNLEEWWIK